GLRLLAVTTAVQPDLGQHQRTVVGQVVQPVQVGDERLAALEEDVEADEVEEVELEVLGSRIVDVSDKRLRIGGAGRVDQPADEVAYCRGAMPAYDRRGNLVADR